MPGNKLGFSQKHPFLFGFSILAAAMALFIGAMAVFRIAVFDGPRKITLGDKIGMVNIQGMILDSREVNEWIATLRDDDGVKGVLVRIDSPGGVVSPSQEIYQAIKRLSNAKPVVVSMGAVAASGGYYIACPADAIVANPGTLTGSIGVKMQLTNLMGIMDKIGVSHKSLTSGKFKDSGSPYRELTSEEEAYFNAVIMDLYEQFVSDVAEGRKDKMNLVTIKSVADGRIFTGRQALKNGLVDKLGGLEDALDLLKSDFIKTSEELPIIEGPVKESSFIMDLLQNMNIIDPAESVSGPQWRFLYQ